MAFFIIIDRNRKHYIRDLEKRLVRKKIMTKYVCHRCGKVVTPEELNLMPGSKCPDCGHRILLKTRPPIIKKLKAK